MQSLGQNQAIRLHPESNKSQHYYELIWISNVLLLPTSATTNQGASAWYMRNVENAIIIRVKFDICSTDGGFDPTHTSTIVQSYTALLLVSSQLYVYQTKHRPTVGRGRFAMKYAYRPSGCHK